MRLLFADQFSEMGGAQRCLLDVAAAVRERGWSASAVLPGPGPLASALAEQGVAVTHVPCGPYSSGRKSARDTARFLMDVPAAARRIAALLRRDRTEAVYVNGPRLLAAVALAAGRRVPVLFHCHSLLPQGSATRIARWALRRTNATVIASCHFVGERLRPYPYQVIYNGVAAAPGRFAGGVRRIGIVGRIAPEKGQADFIQAARILHGELPKLKFLLAGAPLFADAAAARYAGELYALAAGLPVDFLGWVEDTGALLRQLDVLVVPSSSVDATPRVILEAFACGVPVVAYRVGGIGEIVSDGETGFLVSPTTPEALAARIRELALGDPGGLVRVACAGFEASRTKFSLRRFQQQVLEAIERRSA